MNKVIFVFVFLIFIASVLAMSEPIVVKAESGQKVKLYAWPAGGGALLNLVEGVADADGVFSTTFFTLVNENVRYQVIVIDPDGKKVYDTKFDGFGIDKPLEINCTGDDCVMSVSVSKDLVVEEDEGASENTNQSAQVGETRDWEIPNYFYYVGGGILVLVILVFMWFRTDAFRNWVIRMNYFSEEGELMRIEAEIKRKDELIAKIKEREENKKKIDLAKKKLGLENKKLEEVVRKNMRE